jgi:hypothetical protein
MQEKTTFSPRMRGGGANTPALLGPFNPSFLHSHSINPDLVTKTTDMELVKNNVINI